MQTFYINLDSRPDRRAAIEALLQAASIEAERIAAVTPADLPAAAQRFCDPGTSKVRWVAPTQLACTMSHRKIWQAVVDRDLPYALVLEDDAHFFGDLTDRLKPVIAGLDGLDLVHLETRRVPVTIEAGPGLRRIYSFMPGTAAYIVTQAGAAKLMRTDRFEYPVDDIMFDPRGPMFDKLEIRQCVPAPCIAADVIASPDVRDSDISPTCSLRDQGMAARRNRPVALIGRLALRIREEARERSARARGAQRYMVPYWGGYLA